MSWVPRYPTQHQPSVPDDALFALDMNMSTSPGSLISDRGVPDLIFESLASLSGTSHMNAYPPPYSPFQQGQQIDNQQGSFSFNSLGPSNAMPKNHLSLLSQRLNAQPPVYVPTYGNNVATSPATNQPPFHHSAGQASLSQMHNFMGTLMKTNDHDQYLLKNDDDSFDFNLLSPEVTSPASDWSVDPGQAHSQPIGIPINKSHGRPAAMNNSVRGHPYPRPPSYGGSGDMNLSLTSPSFTDGLASFKQFAPHQQQAAMNIAKYKQDHPGTAIPASFITSELAEVYEGRGWCLIGNCGLERAKQKVNPHYDVSKDSARKRLDHLYDHIRDKHFNCRPFRCFLATCTQTFSREHDLKRHEKTHSAMCLPCEFCGKNYTREDNLRRHVQLKHTGIALSFPQITRVTPNPSFTY